MSRADDPQVLAFATALGSLLESFGHRHESPPVDELVAVAPEPLADLGLEYRPVLALAQAGTLRTVWIGRRRFTKRSWLAALADMLPSAANTEPLADDLADAVRRRARRKLRIVGAGTS